MKMRNFRTGEGLKEGRGKAFTLIELLVATAVLAVLVVLFLQILSMATTSTRLSNRAVDAASQARLAFDRMGRDLENLVKDHDADFSANDAGTGPVDSLVFLSRTISAGIANLENRGVSLIAYRVDAAPEYGGRPCLQRAGRAISWSDTGFLGTSTNGLAQTFPSALLPATADFDLLAQGVIRMVVGLQLYPDNEPVELADNTTLANARGQIVYSVPLRVVEAADGSSSVKVVDLNRVSALVVGFVTIDLDTLKLLDATQTKSLAAAFPAPLINETPVDAWATLVSDPGALPAALPLPARQGVRTFQRFFPITPNGSRPDEG